MYDALLAYQSVLCDRLPHAEASWPAGLQQLAVGDARGFPRVLPLLPRPLFTTLLLTAARIHISWHCQKITGSGISDGIQLELLYKHRRLRSIIQRPCLWQQSQSYYVDCLQPRLIIRPWLQPERWFENLPFVLDFEPGEICVSLQTCRKNQDIGKISNLEIQISRFRNLANSSDCALVEDRDRPRLDRRQMGYIDSRVGTGCCDYIKVGHDCSGSAFLATRGLDHDPLSPPRGLHRRPCGANFWWSISALRQEPIVHYKFRLRLPILPTPSPDMQKCRLFMHFRHASDTTQNMWYSCSGQGYFYACRCRISLFCASEPFNSVSKLDRRKPAYGRQFLECFGVNSDFAPHTRLPIMPTKLGPSSQVCGHMAF